MRAAATLPLPPVNDYLSSVNPSLRTPMDTTVSAEEAKRRREAFVRLLARLRSQPVIDIGPWNRDELYERDGRATTQPAAEPSEPGPNEE
jgi:hypothetical protein